MGEMQMIGGYDLSTLAGEVCSCDAAQSALMPDVVGKSVTFISGQHLQHISDTLQGLLIHANRCVNSCNDFSFIKHSFIMLPGHDADQIFRLRAFFQSYFRQPRIAEPLGTPCLLTLSGASWKGGFSLYLSALCPSSMPQHPGTSVRHLIHMFVEMYKIWGENKKDFRDSTFFSPSPPY